MARAKSKADDVREPLAEAVESVDTAAAAKSGDVDRVQMVSRKPDGSADQTPGFERVVPTEEAVALDKAQLGAQAASNVDAVVRREARASETERGDEGPGVKELREAQDSAIAGAERQAERDNK
jgi:hypothetical protein